MTYLDFEVSFGSGAGGSFSVKAEAPGGGVARGSFHVPLDARTRRTSLDAVAREVRSTASPQVHEKSRHLTPAAPRPESSPAKALGEQLFQALLGGGLAGLWHQALGSARAQDKLLRLSIVLVEGDPALRPLAGLPWELLFDPGDASYLVRSGECSIVRSLEVSRPMREDRAPTREPLRILVAQAEPSDWPPLGLGREASEIVEAWGMSGSKVEIRVLPRAGPGDLLDALSERRFQVLHFMGHGGFDHATGKGALVLHSPSGDSALLPATTLADLVGPRSPLRLVVLNACDTGRSATETNHAAFAGVGAALVRAGLPATVAMQFSISNRAAEAFSRAFYQELAGGAWVDDAVRRGRLAVIADRSESLEWCTPVLYQRCPMQLVRPVRPPVEPPPPPLRPATYLTSIGNQAVAWAATAHLVDGLPMLLPGGPELGRAALGGLGLTLALLLVALYGGNRQEGRLARSLSAAGRWGLRFGAAALGLSLWYAVQPWLGPP